MSAFNLLPPQASTLAPAVDRLYLFLVAVSTVIVGIVVVLVLTYIIRYRHTVNADRRQPSLQNLPLEWGRIGTLAVVFLVIFFWGAGLYFRINSPPADAKVIYMIGKQWMWQVQHAEGVREIDTLHVPVGQPIKLVMTSQDVIHSVFIPAFRAKQDVLPGRYTALWFEATQPGEYHLFCAEYCGTHHASMVGKVVAMAPAAFASWLAQRGPEGARRTLATAGRAQFQRLGCMGCHGPQSAIRAPNLAGIYGKPQPLRTGEFVIADEDYLRESIYFPERKVVAGYEPVMPSFQGQISEAEMIEIIAYLKSLANRTSYDLPEEIRP